MPAEGQQAQMRLEHQQRLHALQSQLQTEEQAAKQAAEQKSRWGAALLDGWRMVQAVRSLLAGGLKSLCSVPALRLADGAAHPAGFGRHWLLHPLRWRCGLNPESGRPLW